MLQIEPFWRHCALKGFQEWVSYCHVVVFLFSLQELNALFSEIYAVYQHFIGQPHFDALLELLSYEDIAMLLRELMESIRNLVCHIIQMTHDGECDMLIYRVGQKTGLFLKVCNSPMCWHSSRPHYHVDILYTKLFSILSGVRLVHCMLLHLHNLCTISV